MKLYNINTSHLVLYNNVLFYSHIDIQAQNSDQTEQPYKQEQQTLIYLFTYLFITILSENK